MQQPCISLMCAWKHIPMEGIFSLLFFLFINPRIVVHPRCKFEVCMELWGGGGKVARFCYREGVNREGKLPKILKVLPPSLSPRWDIFYFLNSLSMVCKMINPLSYLS